MSNKIFWGEGEVSEEEKGGRIEGEYLLLQETWNLRKREKKLRKKDQLVE